MDERESMDLLHTGSLIVCHELAKLGLREITAELQARHKCSLNPGKFLAQLVCAVIMNTKTARDFPYTPELVQHRFLRLQGSFPDSLPYDYAEFCRMLAVIGREAEAIQAMLYRLNAEAAGSSTQAELYYSTEYFVFSNPDPDDTLHYGFSAQSGYVRLIMNGQGLPVAFDLAPDTASGKVRKQELQALTERLQQDFNLTVTTLRPRVKAEQAEARSHISRTLRLLKMLLTSQLVFGQEEHQARGMMTVCLLALLVLRKLDDQTAGVLPKKNRTDKTIAALKSLTALPVNEEYCIRSFCRSDITKTLQQSAGLLFLSNDVISLQEIQDKALF